jgi:nickel transport protein
MKPHWNIKGPYMFWTRFELIPRLLFLLTLTMIFSFFMADDVEAHKITVFAWAEGNTVYGQSKFGGGRKPKDATVIVTDQQGRELFKTQTDANGEFSFPIPQKTDLRIQLIAGMGHQGEWLIAAEELGAPAAGSARTPPAATVESPAMPEHSDSHPITVDMQALQELIEAALDQKLRPVLKKLTEAQARQVTLQDIIGGIGYILGLMGIAMYFKSRRRDR